MELEYNVLSNGLVVNANGDTLTPEQIITDAKCNIYENYRMNHDYITNDDSKMTMHTYVLRYQDVIIGTSVILSKSYNDNSLVVGVNCELDDVYAYLNDHLAAIDKLLKNIDSSISSHHRIEQ